MFPPPYGYSVDPNAYSREQLMQYAPNTAALRRTKQLQWDVDVIDQKKIGSTYDRKPSSNENANKVTQKIKQASKEEETKLPSPFKNQYFNKLKEKQAQLVDDYSYNEPMISHFKNYMNDISNQIPSVLKNQNKPHLFDNLVSTIQPLEHKIQPVNDLGETPSLNVAGYYGGYGNGGYGNEYFEKPSTPSLSEQAPSLYDDFDSSNHVLNRFKNNERLFYKHIKHYKTKDSYDKPSINQYGNFINDPISSENSDISPASQYHNDFTDLPNHGVFHDKVPIDDHLTRGEFGDVIYNSHLSDLDKEINNGHLTDPDILKEINMIEKQQPDFLRPSSSLASQPSLKHTMNAYHRRNRKKKKRRKSRKNKKIDLERKLVNPLDYHLRPFPQHENSESLNKYFEKETERITKHVNEFPIVSDKQRSHPSVYNDYLNMSPANIDEKSVKQNRGSSFGTSSNSISPGMFGSVERPEVGIGLAAGGPVESGNNVLEKKTPLQKFLESLAETLNAEKDPCKETKAKLKDSIRCNILSASHDGKDLPSPHVKESMAATNTIDNLITNPAKQNQLSNLLKGAESLYSKINNISTVSPTQPILPTVASGETEKPTMVNDHRKIDPFQVLTSEAHNNDADTELSHLEAASYQKLTSEGSPHPSFDVVDNINTHVATEPVSTIHPVDDASSGVTHSAQKLLQLNKVSETLLPENKVLSNNPMKYQVGLLNAHHEEEKQPMSIAADPLQVVPLVNPSPPPSMSIASDPLQVRPALNKIVQSPEIAAVAPVAPSVIAPLSHSLSIAPVLPQGLKHIETLSGLDLSKPLPVIGISNPYEVLTSNTNAPAREVNSTKPKKIKSDEQILLEEVSSEIKNNSSSKIEETSVAKNIPKNVANSVATNLVTNLAPNVATNLAPNVTTNLAPNVATYLATNAATNGNDGLQPTINDAINQITTLLKSPKIMSNAEALNIFADTLKQISQTVAQPTTTTAADMKEAAKASQTVAQPTTADMKATAKDSQIGEQGKTSDILDKPLSKNKFLTYHSSGKDQIRVDKLHVELDDEEDKFIRPKSLFKKLSDQTYKEKEGKNKPGGNNEDVEFARFSKQNTKEHDSESNLPNKLSDNAVPKWTLPKLLKAFNEMNKKRTRIHRNKIKRTKIHKMS